MSLFEQFMGSLTWEVTELRLSSAYSSAKLSGISPRIWFIAKFLPLTSLIASEEKASCNPQSSQQHEDS